MSRLSNYIKRGIHYIIHGEQRVIKVNPNIVTLAPNELLKSRTALITGGTRGIGKAIAEAFLNAGANVIITSRKKENADEIVRYLKNRYPSQDIIGVEMDVSDTRNIQPIFNEIIKTIYPNNISILVNNAGVSGGRFGATTYDDWERVIRTNLEGTFFLSEYVAQYMRSNQIIGNILMISSSSSIRPAMSAYHLSKWSMRGLTLGLAKMCAPFGITVNAVAPGPTATDMLGKGETSDIYRKNSPINRYALPEEIANVAVMLCSDIGKCIVGDTIYITGGAGLITLDDIEYNF